MIAWKFKLWRTAGAAAALGLAAACSGENGAGEAGDTSAVGGEAGEAVIGEGGGEHGEAGVSDAYAGVTGDQLIALRIQHLRGFVEAAQTMLDAGGEAAAAEAAVLVQQGLLEVYEPAPNAFGTLDVAPLRAAGDGAALTTQQMQERVRVAEGALDRAMSGLDVDYANLVVRLVDISAGLYQHVPMDGYADPTEYKHSRGAALAAQATLYLNQTQMRRRDARAYNQAVEELNTYLALWPSAEPPEQISSYQQVLVQASRVRLALSPFL